MKTIPVEQGYEEMLQLEFDILRRIDHPFLLDLVEVYYSKQTQALHLILPLYTGGEVYTRIIEKQLIPEKECAVIIQQALLGVNYLHSQGITHRDLKPENMVYERRLYSPRDMIIKIIDFGFACDTKNKESVNVFMGTPYYMAPEVVREEEMTLKSDLWSIGIILYSMLVGYPPFAKAKTMEELYTQIKTCDFDFFEDDWADISPEARKFVERLIQPSLKLRYSAAEALKDKWITTHV